jgi:cyclic pyranopterin phosphate synthase
MPALTERTVTTHRAVAEAEVAVSQATLSAVVDGTNPKGDVLSVAELAGVMAGKRASDLIPLAHGGSLTELLVKAIPDRAAGAVRVTSETASVSAAGVEVEAMTAAAVAALAVYDMIRDIEPEAEIRSVRLVSSTSGEQPAWRRPGPSGGGLRAPKGARIAGRVGGGPARGPNHGL